MNTRFTVFAVTLSLSMGVYSAMGWSQQQKAVENKSDAGMDQSVSEPHGKVVRDAPETLRVQDMTMEELQQRLAEYESGKRDYRDGYIILNQLWFNHQLQKTIGSADAQRIAKMRQELVAKYPALNNLKDFRLSDRIRYDDLREKSERKQKETAKSFVPRDVVPLDIRGAEDKAIVRYQYRLDFLKLPNDVQVTGDPKAGSMQLVRDGKELAPSQIQPSKTIQFKRPINARYGRDASGKIVFGNLLICTDMLRGYSPTSGEEYETVRLRGHEHSILWKNLAGQYDDFCGVISKDGQVVYQFPVTQKIPDRLLSPVSIDAAGKKAIVMVGEMAETGPDSTPTVAYPREVLVWEAPAQFKRHSVDSAPKDVRDILAPYPRKPKK